MTHKVKLLCLAAVALFAFGAVAVTSAYAEEKKEPEEENKPRILVIVGEAKELKATLTGQAPIQLIRLAGTNTISATGVTLKIENCTNLAEHEKDTDLCKDQPIDFTGVKQGAVGCRSENAKGEKDPVETVLSLLNLHVVAQLSNEKVLKPAIQAQILGTALEEELKINCGTVKSQEKAKAGEARAAVIECLVLPGLEQVKLIEVLCKVNETTHDPIVGTCNVLCTDFGAVGLQADLDGINFEHAWKLIHLKGETNKQIYIDD